MPIPKEIFEKIIRLGDGRVDYSKLDKDQRGKYIVFEHLTNVEDTDFEGAVLWNCYPSKISGAIEIHPANSPNDLTLEKLPLSGSNFGSIDLSKVNLENLDLRSVNFQYAELTYASFYGSDLRGADFSNADLTEAGLRGAKIDRSTNFEGTVLSNVDIDEGTLGDILKNYDVDGLFKCIECGHESVHGDQFVQHDRDYDKYICDTNCSKRCSECDGHFTESEIDEFDKCPGCYAEYDWSTRLPKTISQEQKGAMTFIDVDED
jgi:hypothetical protein